MLRRPSAPCGSAATPDGLAGAGSLLTRMLHLSSGLQPGGRFDEWRRPPVRAVFLDVDGTSLGEHEEPTAAFVDACQAVQDRGATLSFATGRPPAGVDVVRKHTGSRGADVVHNGALVLDGGTPIGGWPMPATAAARIAQWSLDHQVYAEFAVGSDFLVSDCREVARPAFDDIAGGPDGAVADVDLTAAETFKITIYAFEQEHGPAAIALGEELGLHVDPSTAPIFPGVNILNLTASGISKGNGVEWAARRAGIPARELLVVGDSGNDVSMFAVAGTAVAMGQASDEIKAAAHLVTEPFDDDGCALALHALLDQIPELMPAGAQEECA
jgi:Cof subfamily protein (haloacid dehalogenase superfamily)